MARQPLIIIMIILFISPILNTKAEAISAFARKYKTSCATCHIAFPKLNAFGEAFRMNGYKIPEADERYIKEKPVSLGAPGWKEAWPEGIWPGEIPGALPLSLSGSLLYRYDTGSRVEHDFTFPNVVILQSAGTLGEDVSFYGSVLLIRGGNEFGGLGRLFLKFNNPFGSALPDRLFNVTVGQFEPSAVPFPRRNGLTATPYLMNTFAAGKSDFRFSNQRGIEIDGIIKSRFEYAVGVVNGNGTGKTDASTNSADNNTTKDTYLRIGYKFGGIGLDGSGLTAGEEDTLPEVKAEKSLYVGAIGYSGDNKLSAVAGEDNFYRYGFTIDLKYEAINLYGALIQGKHDNPRGDFKETSVTAYFSEADIVFYPWLIGVVRYGVADVEYEEKKDEVIIGLVALIRANIKLIIEGALHTTGGESDMGLIKLDFAL